MAIFNTGCKGVTELELDGSMMLSRPEETTMMKRLIWLPVVLALSGCELLGLGSSCTSALAYGVNVTRVDSLTGGPIIAENVMVVATDGAYADTVRVPGDAPDPTAPINIVEDRPGTYRVEVSADGYAPWVRTNVQVTDPDGCHVETVKLTARMQSLSSNSGSPAP